MQEGNTDSSQHLEGKKNLGQIYKDKSNPLPPILPYTAYMAHVLLYIWASYALDQNFFKKVVKNKLN
jgi:hypothetical protein